MGWPNRRESALGHERGSTQLTAAVQDALEAGVTTPDLGGTGTTGSVAEWIATRVAD